MLLPLHIFVMESLAWTSPRARAAVGATAGGDRDHRGARLPPTRSPAAVGASGTAAILLGHKAIGVCAGVGSRAAAAVPPVGLRGAGRGPYRPRAAAGRPDEGRGSPDFTSNSSLTSLNGHRGRWL
ncbi:hypothetical protein MOKP101_10550 [Mycobacterium avium subsp. hominissuis]